MRQRTPGLPAGWSALFALGTIGAVAFVVVPSSLTTELLLYDGVVALAVVVSAVGWHRAEQGHRRAWLCSSIGLAGFLVGDLLWWGYGVAGQSPFPSLADVFSLAGYVPLGIAASLLVSKREREHDRTAWLDAGILMAVAGLLIWSYVMEPYVGDANVGRLSLAVTLAYPLADLLVLGLVIRLLFSPTARNRATTAFTIGVLLILSADLSFAWQNLSGNFVTGSWIDGVWLLGYLFIAFAPLHSAEAQSTSAGSRGRANRGRLVVVLAAVVVPQAVLISALAGLGLMQFDTVSVAACASMTVMVLVVARLWGLVGSARRTEERRGEERLAALVHHSADGILLVGTDFRISFASPAAEALCARSGEACIGTSLLDSFVADSQPAIAKQLANLAAMPEGAIVPLEGTVCVDGESIVAVEGTVCNLLADASVRALVVTLRDVTARRTLEEQLERRAFHDDLTGLANRALFADRVAHALSRSVRQGEVGVAVLFIDLDDFKAVNDGLGHGAGDELLRGVAARIRSGLRPGDTVARLGGDEFAVLLEDVPSLDYASEVAARVIELLLLPIEMAGVSLAVPASVGVTLAARGCSVESLLRDADIAMYNAKSQGKGQVALFDESLRDIASQHLALKIELPEALRSGQFRLDYQPIVDVRSETIRGFEALIRWHHPERGVVAPGQFIAAAEASGIIVDIGRWVLERACQQAVLWNNASAHPLTMSVNVSATQLHNPGFIDVLRSALADSGLAPSLLTIELTESILVEHTRVAQILEEIRAVGVSIAIDDFGTGYSSLSYLQKFPVTSVKVDRTFVAELAARGDSGLVRSILSLAEALGLTTVAEGVETAGQLEALNALECDLAQGFFLGYPQNSADITELLGAESAAARAGLYASEPSRP
jgi:diguanylate cyclase (GGDEF)-like protein/PAS domain S-box-containing protein